MERLTRKQVAFDVHPLLHKRIKIEAAKRGISMNMFICLAIERELENNGTAQKKLKSVLTKKACKNLSHKWHIIELYMWGTVKQKSKIYAKYRVTIRVRKQTGKKLKTKYIVKRK